jgi:hypothetical protein
MARMSYEHDSEDKDDNQDDDDSDDEELSYVHPTTVQYSTVDSFIVPIYLHKSCGG